MPYTELLLRPSRDKRPHRLHCRLTVEPHPAPDRLKREAARIAEVFVADMHKQGWEYDGRYRWQMTGPYPVIRPQTIRVARQPSARELLALIRQGARVPSAAADDGAPVQVLTPLAEADAWDYEISAVFVRAILTEHPDAHEERH